MDEIVFLYVCNVIIVTKLNTNRYNMKRGAKTQNIILKMKINNVARVATID